MLWAVLAKHILQNREDTAADDPVVAESLLDPGTGTRLYRAVDVADHLLLDGEEELHTWYDDTVSPEFRYVLLGAGGGDGRGIFTLLFYLQMANKSTINCWIITLVSVYVWNMASGGILLHYTIMKLYICC